jgi:hypothetical protein
MGEYSALDAMARSMRNSSEKPQYSGQFHPLSNCRAITMRWIWLVPS